MKAAIITRIVIYSVLILVLCGVLVAGIMGGGVSFGMNFDYEDAKLYAAGGGSIDSSKINEIEVEWIDGEIRIIENRGADIITFSEEGGSEPMQYLVKGDKLIIKFCKPLRFMKNVDRKELTIGLPIDKSLNKLAIENINGNIKSYVFADIDNVSVESVNGDVDMQGNFENIDCETVSGDIRFFTGKTLHSGDFESVSSDITLELFQTGGANDIKGFSAEIDSISGKMETDFDVSVVGDVFVYGDGGCELDFDTVSGDVKIIRQTNHRGN